jgi:hypothetical protein
MSILSELGTKIGAQLKSIDNRVFALENAPTSSSLDNGGIIDGDLTVNGKTFLGGTISPSSSAKLQVYGFQRTGPIMIASGVTGTTDFDTINEKWITNNNGVLTIGNGSSHGSPIITEDSILELSNPVGGFDGYYDTRDLQNKPQDYARGLRFDFNRNSIDGLSDGGTYHLTASFRNWSSGSDWSGGGVRQLAFTDNHNMWLRGANADNVWTSWNKVLHSGNTDVVADSITASPNGDINLAAGAYVTNFRALTSYGNGLTLSSDRITVNKSGVYQIIQSFLFNTGTSGSNGDTRIQINGTDYVAGYSFASDSANWEKSVASLVIHLSAGDYIRVKMQSAQYLWGSSSGYSHSTLTVSRVGN